ncbi:hypothetical protein OHA25_18965 [Nonomuraea sp. NBC_00507]|uniref:hypothetical protein n=1 Tax=Nonomuraea sp. NBC_00507 TaxID=2976002 RepID=UPI002E16BB31
MLVILAIAAIAILACVVLVSLGRGGELTEFPPDVPPLDLPEPGQLTAVDFMALQLPVNLVGYHTASVDETLRRAANAISARDTRIAVLEQRVSELLSSRLHARQEVYAAPGGALRTDHSPEAPAVARELPESGDPMSASGTTLSWDQGAKAAHAQGSPEWRLQAGNGAASSAEEPSAGDGPAFYNEEPSADGEAADRPDDLDDQAHDLDDQAHDLDDQAHDLDDQAHDLDHEPRETADEAKAGDEAGASDEPEGETGAAEQRVRATLGKDGDERP